MKQKKLKVLSSVVALLTIFTVLTGCSKTTGKPSQQKAKTVSNKPEDRLSSHGWVEYLYKDTKDPIKIDHTYREKEIEDLMANWVDKAKKIADKYSFEYEMGSSDYYKVPSYFRVVHSPKIDNIEYGMNVDLSLDWSSVERSVTCCQFVASLQVTGDNADDYKFDVNSYNCFKEIIMTFTGNDKYDFEDLNYAFQATDSLTKKNPFRGYMRKSGNYAERIRVTCEDDKSKRLQWSLDTENCTLTK